jgi:O-glycosyl hydrolase
MKKFKANRQIIILLAVLLMLPTVFVDSVSAATTVTINGATTYQTIDGFGAAADSRTTNGILGLSASNQTYILDTLFSQSGAGLNMLRLQMADSGNQKEAASHVRVGSQ